MHRKRKAKPENIEKAINDIEKGIENSGKSDVSPDYCAGHWKC